MDDKKITFNYYEGITTLTSNLLLSMIDKNSQLKNKDIGDYLLLTPNAVSRLIRQLKEDGYIEVTLVGNKYRTLTLTKKTIKIKN